MDHSHMNHGGMDMGHGGMDMGGKCTMNMLFTWDTNNLCIIFHWWHIRSTFTLLLSLLAIVFLTAGYEAIRSMTRRYESWVERQQGGSITPETVSLTNAKVPIQDSQDERENNTENTPFLFSGRSDAASGASRAHIVKSALYAVQNFYAFMLMLLFMTYNGWVMLAVGVGSFVGYFVFGKNVSAAKETACH
ncbi:copper transport CTR2 protein [Rutstroemia sp. NJR-2017a BBW]|nr:copper transport CTR2 protein [Rutstroemia sp. NJR-2017a BBW]